MKTLIQIFILIASIQAYAESTLERTVRCSNHPNSYNCGRSNLYSSSGYSETTPSSDDGMNSTERAYCKETGNCGANARAVETPKAKVEARASQVPQTVPAYLLPPKRDDNALRAMHADISARIATLESYIQSRQYGASVELAQQLIVYAQEQVGFDAEVQLQEKIRVQPGALAWPSQQRNDAMAIALKQYRGGLYVQLLNMYKRVKLMWTVANYNLLKQRGSIKPGAKETLRNEMLTAYMVPIYFVDQMQPQAYVLTFDFMLVNPIANFHYNAELEIIADSLKELGFTSETFVEQAKSLALSKSVTNVQSAPAQSTVSVSSAIQPGQDLASVLIAREDQKQAQVIPTMLSNWAARNQRAGITSYKIRSRRDQGTRESYYPRALVEVEALLADNTACRFDLIIYLGESGATGRTVFASGFSSNSVTGYCL